MSCDQAQKVLTQSMPPPINEIREILRRPIRNISHVLPSIKISRPDKEFQFFEVVSTYILSLIERDYEWTVTPLQHDSGVDFYGRKVMFRLLGLKPDCQMVIAGQCKTSKSMKTPLPEDLWGLLESRKPALVLLFLMADISKERILRSQRVFSSQTNRQCRILALNDVIKLLQLYHYELLPLLSFLNSKDRKKLQAFLQKQPIAEPDNVGIEIKIPEKVLAGTPFRIQVNVHSVLVCKGTLYVRLLHSTDVLLIKPVEIIDSQGYLLKAEQGFSLCFSIKLVSYHVGEISLGDLVFEAGGIVIKAVPLGSLTTINQYHPVFFWEPYRSHRTRMLELMEKSEANHPEGVAIIGQGGSGKTRFCLEIGYLAEQRGAQLISISHPQDMEHPYELLGMLTQELLANPFDSLDPKQALEVYIRSLHPKLYQRAKSTIAMIFSSGAADGSRFDPEAMLQILLVILLQKVRTTRYVLHFSDLHWASAEALGILGDLLQRLKKIAPDYGASVLILFEGRIRTSLKPPDARSSAHSGSSAIFETFLNRYQLEQLEVRSFTKAQSHAFLVHLFETAQSENRRVTAGLIPHQELLIREIARYGQGNPFHMIEQIKLLRSREIVATNQRTGLVFLKDIPDSHYEVPVGTHDLISLRVKFIEGTSPELALLVKAVSFIKDRIDLALFRLLRQKLARRVPDSAIHEIEILDTDSAHEIGFRHENYYKVVHDLLLSESERRQIASLYLKWYAEIRPKSAEILYEEALVHANCLRVNTKQLKSLLELGLRKAEASYQFQLAIQIIGKLLQVLPMAPPVFPKDFTAILGALKLRIKLADLSNDLQDWRVGAQRHEEIIRIIDNYLKEASSLSSALQSQLQYLKTFSMLELANSNADLGKSHESIRLLTEARKNYQIHANHIVFPESAGRAKWHKLYGRILNRLGEANWMDGNYADALRAFEASRDAVDEKVAQAKDRHMLHHINFLDYGAVLLHQDPAKAVRMLKKSISLIPASGWSPRYGILADTTLAIGEIVRLFLRENGNSERTRHFLVHNVVSRLQHNFEKSALYGFKQEQTAASLMLGISLSLLNDGEAAQWYMESIEVSLKSGNFESLWRGHLNLAQYLYLTGDLESCVFHCQRACELLSRDLQGRTPQERHWRQRHLMRPIFQVARLLPKEELSRAPFICTLLEQAKANSLAKNTPCTPAFFKDKIIFLWDRGNEYYPYGG